MSEKVRLRVTGADQVMLMIAPTKKALQRWTQSENKDDARRARRILKRFDRLGVRVSDVAKAFAQKRTVR